MSTLFISATGTGIGKTYFLTQLLEWDQSNTRRFTACKPVISGWPEQNEEIQHTDTGLILKAQNLPCDEQMIAHISPWRYFAPLTPDMAAKVEGKILCPKALVKYCLTQGQIASSLEKTLLIEGVGGLMSPISGCFTGLEWILELKCPVILVTGSYLGTLSHTLTALKILALHQVDVFALIVNETPDSHVPLEETCASLKAFTTADVYALRHGQENRELLAEIYEKVRAGSCPII
jgi:dethiobiotin synthetase